MDRKDNGGSVETLTAGEDSKLGVPAAGLAKIDGVVRKAVKKWLHLPSSTCNGLLYSQGRDGGLGVLKLERLIPSIQLWRTQRMCRSSDYWTRTLTKLAVSQEEWAKLWVAAGGNPEGVPVMSMGSTSLGEVESQPDYPDWRRTEHLIWAGKRVQGVGVDQFRGDKVSNSWLPDPTTVGFRQRHWIAGLSLRAGVYPTKEFLARGLDKAEASCRRCQARLESCSHILGQCAYVKRSRILQHNKVCELLATEEESFGWTVTREFRVDDPEGDLRIPDLVCKKGETVLILDVTVRYEMDSGTLLPAAEEKVAHYNPVAREVAQKVGGSCVKVMGFTVGARGKWPTCNYSVLAELGVPKGRQLNFARLVSRRILLYSLDVLRDFLREPREQGLHVPKAAET